MRGVDLNQCLVSSNDGELEKREGGRILSNLVTGQKLCFIYLKNWNSCFSPFCGITTGFLFVCLF